MKYFKQKLILTFTLNHYHRSESYFLCNNLLFNSNQTYKLQFTVSFSMMKFSKNLLYVQKIELFLSYFNFNRFM